MSVKNQRLVYLAGPISEFTDDQGVVHSIKQNVLRAANISSLVWIQGDIPLTPHLLSAWEFLINDWVDFSNMSVQLNHSEWMERDFKMLSKCDAILMLPNWEYSKGARMEHDFAAENYINVWYFSEEDLKHVV